MEIAIESPSKIPLTAATTVKEAWQNTLEETGVNPFPQGFSSTLSQLAMEQDFATGGNDDFSAVTWKAALRL